MNIPTIIIALLILAAFVAIIAKGIYRWKNGKGGCACGGDCGSCGGSCHTK